MTSARKCTSNAEPVGERAIMNSHTSRCDTPRQGEFSLRETSSAH